MWLSWHLFVVAYEEPALRRRFGAAYQVYYATVPRWLPHVRAIDRYTPALAESETARYHTSAGEIACVIGQPDS